MNSSLKIASSLIAVAFMMCAADSYAEKPIVDGRFSRNGIEVGDQVELILDVEVDRATNIGVLDFGEVVSDEERQQMRSNISQHKAYDEDLLELINDYPMDTIKVDGRTLHLRKRYKFSVMETGIIPLRPALLYFQKNSDTPDTLYADYTLILNVKSYEELDTLNFMVKNPFIAPGAQGQGAQVNTALVDNTVKMDGVKEVRDMPFISEELAPKEEKDNTKLILIIVAIVIVVAIAMYVLWRYLSRRKTMAKEVVLPPHVEANKALEELHHRKLWQNDKHNLYYTLLTDILRRYISRRWNIRAMEYTTDEILAALRNCEISIDSRNNLATILRTADMAKYAKAKPEDEVNEECYTKAFYFVENTKLVDEQSVEGKEDITIDTKIGE